jgi:hypothetical protein
MIIFQAKDVAEAKAHAMAGGQALHVHRIIADRSKAPMCFVRAIDRGEDLAHLFDQDIDRLTKTVRSLGVKAVFVEYPKSDRQHVDLCGGPLRKAKAMCEAV